MSKMSIKVHESKMTAVMARAILNGSAEGDKEEAKKWISLCQESKQSERLSDYSMEDIVDEIVKEVKRKIDDGDTGTDAYNMGIEVGGAIKSWIPNIVTNIAEDVMEKLDIFGTDYDSFYAAIDKAATEAQV